MAFLFYFHPMNSICLNGKIMAAGKPALMVDNRSYRYGDGLFETMKITAGSISLEAFHFERLFAGLKQMAFEIPALLTKDKLAEQVMVLCQKNNCQALG